MVYGKLLFQTVVGARDLPAVANRAEHKRILDRQTLGLIIACAAADGIPAEAMESYPGDRGFEYVTTIQDKEVARGRG